MFHWPMKVPRKVLLVEDSLEQCDCMQLLLNLEGYEVQCVHDGAEGVEAVRRLRPKLVIMGIDMPGMDGYEAARRMRALPWGWHMRLIALTGYNEPERSLEAGFDCHLTKPVMDFRGFMYQLDRAFPDYRTVARRLRRELRRWRV